MGMFKMGISCFSGAGPCIADETILAYAVLIVLNLYGLGLFVWWWARSWMTHNKHASPVYMYVTIIFLGALVENSMSFYARLVYWLEGTKAWEFFIIDSPLWPMRKFITNGALLALSIHMSIRAFKNNKPHVDDSGRRRRDDDKLLEKSLAPE